jgi:drug/metabolite transporter (DMT)-like permease
LLYAGWRTVILYEEIYPMNIENFVVPKLAHGMLLLLAVSAVAVADVMLKKAAAQGSLENALSSPWLFFAIGLYFLQILFFTIAFIAGWKLSIIGALQTALYGLIVLIAGVFIYHESLTHLQVIGMLLAIGGVVMINLP